MTLDEKIQEAEFFLNLIRKNQPNVSVVKFHFSAFLSAVESIPDYILAEASQEYGLDLPLDEEWHYWDFEAKAKENEKKNENALLFLKWWRQFYKGTYHGKVGQVIKKIRNMEMHKTKQKPIFNVLWWALPPLEGQKLKKIPVTTTKNTDVKSLDDLDVSINLVRPHILKRENEMREKSAKPPATDIKFTCSLEIPGLPNFGRLDQACETWVQVMKHYTKIARQIMEESKTGTPKI